MAAVLIVVLAIQFGRGGSAGSPAQTPVGGGPFSTTPQATTDISTMSPRERADRLFERIMTAHERGDPQEVSFFKPMALQAYALLGGLDPDARYHVGLIHAATGDLRSGRAQLDSLSAEAPNHLLTSMLRYTIAELAQDPEGMRQAEQGFLEDYEAEIESGKQEYALHKNALDAFLSEARRSVAREGVE